MTLRTVKRNQTFYHTDNDETWENRIKKMFGVEKTIQDLKEQFDVATGGGNRERLLEEMGSQMNGEYVVWHNYRHEKTQVFEVTH